MWSTNFLSPGNSLHTKINAILSREFFLEKSFDPFNPILDGEGGGKFAPPAGFFNFAQKPLGLGS